MAGKYRFSIDIPTNSGLYRIENQLTGGFYVGSAKNLNSRLGTHRSRLRSNKHENKKLQRSWNKHGEDKFKYSVLEVCLENDLLDKEQFLIDSVYDDPKCYNLARYADASMRGRKLNKNQLEALKKANTGRPAWNRGKSWDIRTRKSISRALKNSKKLKAQLDKLHFINRCENHPNSKFLNDDVRNILRLHQSKKLTQKLIAKMYRSAPQTIGKIVRRETYKEITI